MTINDHLFLFYILCFWSFIGEESVSAGAPSILTDSPTWIIDPIDGTTNFVHKYDSMNRLDTLDCFLSSLLLTYINVLIRF